MIKNKFKNSTFLITGGTGSFGKTMLDKLLETDVKEIRIFSRDELKQFNMRNDYNDNRIKYLIGDVRDKNTCDKYLRNVDYVFHAAALKQVPSSEQFPDQAVYTNIIGSINIVDSAINNNVKMLTMLSTDKAVSPINSMGMTKSLMEKYSLSKAFDSKTKINIVRYGNVLFSRGSVFPVFFDLANNKKTINVTDLKMTRFLLTLNDAIDLVLFSINSNHTGKIFVKKAPAATVETMIRAIEIVLKNKVNYSIKGIRPGEKFHEILLSSYEKFFSTDHGNFFSYNSEKIKNFVPVNDFNFDQSNEYSSDKTKLLSPSELSLILKEWIKKGKLLV